MVKCVSSHVNERGEYFLFEPSEQKGTVIVVTALSLSFALHIIAVYFVFPGSAVGFLDVVLVAWFRYSRRYTKIHIILFCLYQLCFCIFLIQGNKSTGASTVYCLIDMICCLALFCPSVKELNSSYYPLYHGKTGTILLVIILITFWFVEYMLTPYAYEIRDISTVPINENDLEITFNTGPVSADYGVTYLDSKGDDKTVIASYIDGNLIFRHKIFVEDVGIDVNPFIYVKSKYSLKKIVNTFY
jgi:hypothetical protein